MTRIATNTKRTVVVVGAGVSGLTTGLLLSLDGRFDVTVISKFMPGDDDPEYCSPWAGAEFSPTDARESKMADYQRRTWKHLESLAKSTPEAGIHFQTEVVYLRCSDLPEHTSIDEALTAIQWLSGVVNEFRILGDSELPAGIDGGYTFLSVCINTPVYLSWLVGQCASHSVRFERKVIENLHDAVHLHASGQDADIIVNCTGLGSRLLGGVRDSNLFPVRGQVVVVRNKCPANTMFSASAGPGRYFAERTYAMTRAVGGGTILGGCRQENNWDARPDLNLSNRIMQRCVDLFPGLVREGQGTSDLDVIRHGVGFRPERIGGVRVEREIWSNILVVHNYGHGGSGFSSSYGCAESVLDLIMQVSPAKASESTMLQ